MQRSAPKFVFLRRLDVPIPTSDWFEIRRADSNSFEIRERAAARRPVGDGHTGGVVAFRNSDITHTARFMPAILAWSSYLSKTVGTAETRGTKSHLFSRQKVILLRVARKLSRK
jgi:hypothetical protein